MKEEIKEFIKHLREFPEGPGHDPEVIARIVADHLQIVLDAEYRSAKKELQAARDSIKAIDPMVIAWNTLVHGCDCSCIAGGCPIQDVCPAINCGFVDFESAGAVKDGKNE